jgi:hypothetical protein
MEIERYEERKRGREEERKKGRKGKRVSGGITDKKKKE